MLVFSAAHLTQNQIEPQEKVTVVAVEVPVRVLHKGQVVRGLTKDDFEIYEDGVKQAITDFEVHSRKISLPSNIDREQLQIKEKRLFLLIFNTFDYNENVDEAIDYFLMNYFTDGDRLIIITENTLLDIERGRKLSDLIMDLKKSLKKFKLISSQVTIRDYRELRREADKLLSRLRGDWGADYAGLAWEKAILRFYENYLRIFVDYRKQYLLPNLEMYRGLIARIKQIEGEKWALCFQQRDMFPRLKNSGPVETTIRNQLDSQIEPQEQVKANVIRFKQMELSRLFNIAENFPAEALKNLFLEANITFHLVLMKSSRTLLSNDFELREVAQDYEDCFRQISVSTGGHKTFSNKVVDAIKEASDKEDYYYLLVYNTKEAMLDKSVKIDVKVSNDQAEVIHLKQFSKIASLPITIANFKAQRKTIKFSLLNYQRTNIENKLTGIADVKITLFDENSNKVYEEANTLSLVKDQAHISIPFNQLERGSYFIVIQVLDKFTNHSDVFSRQIKF